jgi:hypothetical protein
VDVVEETPEPSAVGAEGLLAAAAALSGVADGLGAVAIDAEDLGDIDGLDLLDIDAGELESDAIDED